LTDFTPSAVPRPLCFAALTVSVSRLGRSAPRPLSRASWQQGKLRPPWLLICYSLWQTPGPLVGAQQKTSERCGGLPRSSCQYPSTVLLPAFGQELPQPGTERASSAYRTSLNGPVLASCLR